MATVTLPEVKIVAAPADTSWWLTAKEELILLTATSDQLYQAAANSSHAAFVSFAGLILSGRGDLRGPPLSRQAAEF